MALGISSCPHRASFDKERASIEGHIGYTFKDPRSLETALSHRSIQPQCPGKHRSNERLEFLGDAALELFVRDFLITHYPKKSEGELTKLKSSLVDKVAFQQYAQALGLEPYLLISGEVPLELPKVKKTILADTFEAVVGAIKQDGGYAAVDKVLREKCLSVMQKILLSPRQNWKQQLQEYTQSTYSRLPEYAIVKHSDLGYLSLFDVNVFLGESIIGRGSGFSKKEAEQEAAENGLRALKEGGSGFAKREVESSDRPAGRSPSIEFKALSLTPKTSERLPTPFPTEKKGIIFSLAREHKSAFDERRGGASIRSILSQLRDLQAQLASLELEESSLSKDELGELERFKALPPSRTVISLSLIQQGKDLLSSHKRKKLSWSSLTSHEGYIFRRLYSNDMLLKVHFMNSTLKDPDLEILARILEEKNTSLNQLYLRSISIGTVGLRALKRILLFSRGLEKLSITYAPEQRDALVSTVKHGLRSHHTPFLQVVILTTNQRVLKEGRYTRVGHVELERQPMGGFNLQPLLDLREKVVLQSPEGSED